MSENSDSLEAGGVDGTKKYRKRATSGAFKPKKRKKAGETEYNKSRDLKHAVFVQKYVETLSCVEAARAAGYSYPETVGHRIFKNASVQAEIAEILQKKAETAGITAESVLATIERAMKRAEDEGNLPMVYKGAELLGKHLGLFAEKIQHDTRIEIVIPGFDELPVRGPARLSANTKALNWDKDIIDIEPVPEPADAEG